MIDVHDINSRHDVPRRSTALLSDERMHAVTVVSRVREYQVELPRWLDGSPRKVVHRLVSVHIDGEPSPRAIDWSRLPEFITEGAS